MPFFGAIALLPRSENQKRNLLSRGCLINGRFNSSTFSTTTSTGARRRGQELQGSVRRNQVSILTPEDTSGMVGISSHHNVRSRGLRRWRLFRESRPVRYWSGKRRFHKRHHPDC